MALSDHIRKDSPTNNFATLNPLIGGATTLSEGNLYSTISGVNHGAIPNFTLPSSGIWYTEFKFHSIPAGYPAVGLSVYNKIGWNTAGSETDPQSLTFNNSGGTANWEEYGSAFSFSNEVNNINAVINTTNVYALYWDADTNKLTLYDGTNTSSVDVTVNTSQPISFIYAQSSGSTYTVSVNFGQDPTFGGNKTDSAALNPQTNDANGDPTNGAFYYTPPAGAKALCTANLEDITPNVDDDVPGDYFKAVVWSGTDDTSNSITTVGFQPDFVWAKTRSHGYSNLLYDSVRGAGANKELTSDSTVEEGAGNPDTHGYLSAFTSNGFSSTAGNLGNYYFNSPPASYVAWCFRAGGSPSADGKIKIDGTESNISDLVTSTGASLTPTRMSVNTKAGFSIVKYNGTSSAATVPHGLSAKVEFSIVKVIDLAGQVWSVYHKDAGGGLILNQSTAAGSSYDHLASGDNLVSLASGWDGVNGNNNYIMYCWHSVPGYSKFGSYEGASEVFVNLGFRPAFVMVKCINAPTSNQSYYSWTMCDSSRTPYNGVTVPLYANYSKIEGQRAGDTNTFPTDGIDFLSNGFRILSSNYGELNVGAGYNYLYAAFAEQPIKYATAR